MCFYVCMHANAGGFMGERESDTATALTRDDQMIEDEMKEYSFSLRYFFFCSIANTKCFVASLISRMGLVVLKLTGWLGWAADCFHVKTIVIFLLFMKKKICFFFKKKVRVKAGIFGPTCTPTVTNHASHYDRGGDGHARTLATFGFTCLKLWLNMHKQHKQHAKINLLVQDITLLVVILYAMIIKFAIQPLAIKRFSHGRIPIMKIDKENKIIPQNYARAIVNLYWKYLPQVFLGCGLIILLPTIHELIIHLLFCRETIALEANDEVLLISRYTTWLSSGLTARKASDGSPNSPADAEWALSIPIEDFIYIMHDVHAVIGELSESGSFIGHVNQLLGSCPIEVFNLVKQSILQAVEPLKERLPAIINVMIGIIVKKSNEDLKHLKGITATYRMTSKLPVRHSPYVSGILHPLKVFLEGDRIRYLSEDDKTKLCRGSTDKITAIYYDLVSEVVTVARKTESSLQRLRQGAQRRVGASTDASDNIISDTDKICMQLFLDIQSSMAVSLKHVGVSDVIESWILVHILLTGERVPVYD
ncbi:hypothetical protein ACJX0J_022998 [Zea mays]